jgi:FkbM family methyltransferase
MDMTALRIARLPWAIVIGGPAAVWRYVRPLAQACVSEHVNVAGARVYIPGPLPIRLSVVAGNIRMHRLLHLAIPAGGTVVDVGANVGYNTVYASRCVGPAGRVIALEPAADNARVLRENIAVNTLDNVEVHEVAVGRSREIRDLFLRGETSGVNSLFAQSVYAKVTGVEKVRVVPLDDVVNGSVDVVKIDVEGAELDVLGGMARMLRHPVIQLIVEWHPRLQEAAGYTADALPRFLLDRGFTLRAASHTGITRLGADEVDRLSAHLRRHGRPVELVAVRRADALLDTT